MLLIGVQNAWGLSASDPKDTPGGLDIASSSIRVVPISGGAYRTRLAVSTYKAFDLSNGKGSFFWQIDSYGDGAVDYIVKVFGDPDAVPAEPVFCLVKSKNPDIIYKAYVPVTATHTRVVCGSARHDLKMTRDVRLAGRGPSERSDRSGPRHRLERLIERALGVGSPAPTACP